MDQRSGEGRANDRARTLTAEMLDHFGITLPSSLSAFSKSLIGKATAPLGPAGYTNDGEDGDTPPALDEDVLLSYYARLADHRPSSRLLKERMFEHGIKGPRSATLLVSGSPTFERPWRYASRLRASCSCCVVLRPNYTATVTWIGA